MNGVNQLHRMSMINRFAEHRHVRPKKIALRHGISPDFMLQPLARHDPRSLSQQPLQQFSTNRAQLDQPIAAVRFAGINIMCKISNL